MDRRLLEAAQKGDVGLLNDLIKSNALILEEAVLQGAGHTPLHVACVAGHSSFARELLKLMPKLAKKVNADGFSPLHIAAARGDVETVREILKAGRPQDLCRVKGRDRRIPLHYAATNGEVGTMKELLSVLPESVKEMTAQRETALHLSVKNNQFDAFVLLVEHLKQHNMEQVINWKDNRGDTVLHLAAAAKNLEAQDKKNKLKENKLHVVDFMLRGNALKRKVIEVNALNESGSTPLDVSSRSDREIREILTQVGAKHGQSNLSSSQIVVVDDGATSDQSDMKIAVENDHPPPKDSNQGKKSWGDERSDLLVVAVLIASTTYQAVLQPITLFKTIEIHNKKGFLGAYLSFVQGPIGKHIGLCGFLITNTFGFFLSVYMIIRLSKNLTRNLPLKLPLICSTISIVVTYLNCMVTVPSRSLRDEDYSNLGAVLINILAMLISVALLLLTVFTQHLLDLIQTKIALLPEAAKRFLAILKHLGVVDNPPEKSDTSEVKRARWFSQQLLISFLRDQACSKQSTIKPISH
ncbi:hypothetical protein BT93_E1252 [Corymbia citriodora subsp. variegata]|nr:hypothetical protein BT93_E1252 [Corymbia citriodora subsp. variegata]